MFNCYQHETFICFIPTVFVFETTEWKSPEVQYINIYIGAYVRLGLGLVPLWHFLSLLFVICLPLFAFVFNEMCLWMCSHSVCLCAPVYHCLSCYVSMCVCAHQCAPLRSEQNEPVYFRQSRACLVGTLTGSSQSFSQAQKCIWPCCQGDFGDFDSKLPLAFEEEESFRVPGSYLLTKNELERTRCIWMS